MHRVLVFFGGSDSTDETGKALAALAAPGFAHLAVDVVLGANHPDRSRILELVRSRPATNLYENLPTLAGLMARADIALGAGGSTSWERLCLGLCSLVTTVAPNQVAITEAMAAAGLVYWIGHSTETTVDAYRRALQQATGKGLIESEPLVDGLGAKRVAETMMPTGSGALRLRQAREQDAILFFDWRNDPTTRAMSFAQEQISWPAHLAWFRRRLTDASARLYVAEADGLPVGQLRLDFETDHATLSYSIDRLVRGRGWGAWIVAAALERASQAQAIEVRAEVKAENEASRRVFARLGWVETRSADGRIVFRSPPRRSRSAAAARGKRSALH